MQTQGLLSGKRRWLRASLVAVAAFAGAASPRPDSARAAPISSAAIFVDPDSGSADSRVTVFGLGFTPNAMLEISFAQDAIGLIPLGFTLADGAGVFTFDTAAPTSAEPGDAAFAAANIDDPDESATTTFLVTDGNGEISDPKNRTCTVTLTLVSMRIVRRLPAGEDWRIRTTSKMGHHVTEMFKVDLNESEIVLNLPVASKTYKESKFPFKENLRVHVDHESPFKKAPKDSGKNVFDLQCPDDREVFVVVPELKFEGPVKEPDFVVELTYRYVVTREGPQ